MTAGAGGTKKSSSREPRSRESESMVMTLSYCVCLKARSFVYESAQLGPESDVMMCQYEVPCKAHSEIVFSSLK